MYFLCCLRKMFETISGIKMNILQKMRKGRNSTQSPNVEWAEEKTRTEEHSELCPERADARSFIRAQGSSSSSVLHTFSVVEVRFQSTLTFSSHFSPFLKNREQVRRALARLWQWRSTLYHIFKTFLFFLHFGFLRLKVTNSNLNTSSPNLSKNTNFKVNISHFLIRDS